MHIKSSTRSCDRGDFIVNGAKNNKMSHLTIINQQTASAINGISLPIQHSGAGTFFN